MRRLRDERALCRNERNNSVDLRLRGDERVAPRH
jgi:hypothetical protein